MTITGNHLINAGFKPSKWFREAIEWANLNIDNYTEEKLYNEIQQRFVPVPKPTIEPRDEPIDFHCNIEIDTNNEAEVANMFAVTRAMHNILVAPTAVSAAVMPDACPTGEFDIPVGGVIACFNAIHPRFHSADVCCSVMFSNLGKIDPKIVLDKAEKITHFGAGGRQNPQDIIPNALRNSMLDNPYLAGEKSMNKAKTDLKTQGNGNHFLFVGYLKSSGETVLVTHHGSRSFGALLYKKGNDVAEKFRQEIAPNVNVNLGWIPMDIEEGAEYWDALQITREWTKLNHTLIHEEIASKTQTNIYDNYWNEHNFVFKKDNTYFHAKGATPLLDEFVPDSANGLRLIPMNMRDGILIVNGNETETNLGFTSHGAGREMSRTEYTKLSLQNKTGHELFDEDTKGLDVRFYTGKMDITELPSAYKSADKVKNQIQQFNLGNIVDEIIPYGCLMAGHEDRHWKK